MNIKTLIGSIFNKTKRDINIEKRQRIESDNFLQTQVNNIRDGNSIDSFGDAERVLRAKQDKLTAGDNITIENNVISTSGGQLYEHNINAVYDYFESKRYLIAKIITYTSTPFTYNTLKEYLHDHGFTTANSVMMANGNVRQGSNYYNIAGMFETGNTYVSLVIYTSGSAGFTTQYMYSFDSIYDTIVRIL